MDFILRCTNVYMREEFFFFFFLALSVTFAVEYFTREFSFCFLFLDFICSDVVRGLGWG